MIDIIVGNNQVTIEGKNYHSFNEIANLASMLTDIVERCLYSGESIILRIDRIDRVDVHQEWVNPHVSGRYKRMK